MQYYDVELISNHFNKWLLIFSFLLSVVLILIYSLRVMKLRLLCPSIFFPV